MIKLILLFVLLILISGCGGSFDVNVRDSRHVIEVENPIIEYCERLYPEILYPNVIQREMNIVDCLQICQETESCTVDIPVLE